MTDNAKGADRHPDTTPHPDDPRKPESPTDLKKPAWGYVLKKTWREFSEDQCTDLAAALTYYSVLAIFPAAVALLSLLGVVGQDQKKTVDTLIEVMSPLVSEETIGTVRPALEQIAGSNGAGFALLLGVLIALWSASGYVAAFGRAMNRVYEIAEGRPFWKLRPVMLLVTLVLVLLMACIVLMLVVSGGLARSIGDVLGLGSTTVMLWNIIKWPVIAGMVVFAVALLYYATPNVKQPKFRWMSVGAAAAIAVAVVASLLFGFYVSNFSNYNKTYGSLAGVVISLLFLWLVNLALLFGAEIDAELERGRQLQAGIPAEDELQLPARDTTQIEKAEKQQAKDAAQGRRIREQAPEHVDGPAPEDR